MKILLTGSSGFLGKSILSHISQYNDVYTLSRSGSHINIDLAAKIPQINFDVDCIIHAAGLAHLQFVNKKDKKSFYNVNIVGTNNLLSALDNCRSLTKFVYISSVSVYGLTEGKNISETSPLKAKDPYGRSKILVEELLNEWCIKRDIKLTILRLPLVVGKGAPGNLASMLKGIRKGYYFNIGGGVSEKSMVLAQDVAKFIQIISPYGGIYNLTDGVHPSFLALSTAIAKKKTPNLPLFAAKILGLIGDLLGNKFPINSLKVKKITSHLTFDDSKARTMGWNPQSVLDYIKLNDL
jgi:nucleoside-diphosphate-sugar epimerase